jgi:hypothetical protein
VAMHLAVSASFPGSYYKYRSIISRAFVHASSGSDRISAPITGIAVVFWLAIDLVSGEVPTKLPESGFYIWFLGI